MAPDSIERDSGRLLHYRTVAEDGVTSGKYRFEAGDILYSKIRPNLNKVALIDFEGLCSADMYALKVNPNEVVASFLMYALRSAPFLGYATSLSNRANIPKLNRGQLMEWEFDLPSLPEQRRIAAILDHADALRAKRGQVLARIDALTQSILNTFFAATPVTVEPLAQAAEKVVVGHVGPTTEHFRPVGVPFLRTGNVGRGVIIEKDLGHVTSDFHQALKKSQLRGGDVLVSRVISGEVRSAILPGHLEGANCANIIIVRPSERIYPEVVQGFLSLPSTQGRLLGRRVGSAQSVVNTRVLKELQTPIYSLSEQAQLRQVLESVNWERAATLAAETADNELFASLQSRAFRGEL